MTGKHAISLEKFIVVRTNRSVHFACGCFGEYSTPSHFGAIQWNPQPCRLHKSPEDRQALVEACQRESLVATQQLLHGTPL